MTLTRAAALRTNRTARGGSASPSQISRTSRIATASDQRGVARDTRRSRCRGHKRGGFWIGKRGVAVLDV